MSVEVSDTQESQPGAGSGRKGLVGGSMDAPSYVELKKGRGETNEATRSHSLGMGVMKYGRVFFWEKKIKTLILPSTPQYPHPIPPYPTVKFQNIDMCSWT